MYYVQQDLKKNKKIAIPSLLRRLKRFITHCVIHSALEIWWEKVYTCHLYWKIGVSFNKGKGGCFTTRNWTGSMLKFIAWLSCISGFPKRSGSDNKGGKRKRCLAWWDGVWQWSDGRSWKWANMRFADTSKIKAWKQKLKANTCNFHHQGQSEIFYL